MPDRQLENQIEEAASRASEQSGRATQSTDASDMAKVACAAPGPALLSADARQARGRIRTRLMWVVAIFVVACAWDRAAWLAISINGAARFTWIESTLPAQVLYLPVYWFGRWIWLPLAIVFIARAWLSPDPRRVMRGLREGMFVLVPPILAALGAEACKLITRRQRPELNDGWYSFRWWNEGPFDLSNIGLASSHAAAAVAGAIALGVLLPRWRIWAWGMALACATSRILVGAHYLSDVVAGAFIGYVVFVGYAALDTRNNNGVPVDGLHHGART